MHQSTVCEFMHENWPDLIYHKYTNNLAADLTHPLCCFHLTRLPWLRKHTGRTWQEFSKHLPLYSIYVRSVLRLGDKFMSDTAHILHPKYRTPGTPVQGDQVQTHWKFYGVCGLFGSLQHDISHVFVCLYVCTCMHFFMCFIYMCTWSNVYGQ